MFCVATSRSKSAGKLQTEDSTTSTFDTTLLNDDTDEARTFNMIILALTCYQSCILAWVNRRIA